MSEERKWPVDTIHILRTTQQHHVQLSVMADHKANMLIGATFVVFSIAIGKSGVGPPSLPILILGFFAFVAAVLAALAVMPATGGRPALEPNWLFFGAFSRLSEEEFISKMLDEQFATAESINRAMLREIYQLGLVLARKKYRFLNLAYRVFLTGITITFLAFLLELLVGPILPVA